MGSYSIKDIETFSGVQAHTIRIWEQRYGIVEPKRTETNIRFYTDEQLKYILNLAFLNKNGLKISKLAGMTMDQLNSEVEKIYDRESDNSIYMHGLQSAMVDFNIDKFEKIFASSILKDGLLKTMSDLIIPFMQKIGVLWITGSINPAQEHFVTNIIRKKILVAIDGIVHEETPSTKKFILYLPEGEFHEIPLLLAYYIISSHHHKVIYMGSSLPLMDLKSAIKFVEPDYIFTSITVPMADFTIDEYMNIICSSFTDQKVMLAGTQAHFLKQKYSNLTRYTELDELISSMKAGV